MKKFLIICMCIVLAVVLTFLLCNNNNKKDVIWYKSIPVLSDAEDAFDYEPLKEAAEGKGFEAALEVYRIPQEQLENMSTKGLVVSSLSYPMFFMFGAYDSFRQGFDFVKRHSPTITELTQRKDAYELLSSVYLSMDFEQVQKTDESCGLRVSFLELLLSDDDVIDGMPESTRKQLIQKCLENIILYQKESYGEYYTDVTTVLLLGKIMYLDNEEIKSCIDASSELTALLNGEVPELGIVTEEGNDALNQIVTIATQYYY